MFCSLYGSPKETDINNLRYHLFCRKSIPEPRKLPPTKDVLYQHKFAMSSDSSSQPVKLSKFVESMPPSIWSRVIQLAKKYDPVNLGQGFADLAEVVPPRLKSALVETQAPDAHKLNNQYARAQGQVDLVRELALLYGPLYGRTIDAMTEVLVTVGASEALHCALTAVINPGDEVVLIEPYFSLYYRTVFNLGGIVRSVPLRMKPGGTTSNDFLFDKDELTNVFNDKTRCIVVNTPHNPTGKVFTREELEFIADLCKKYDCLYLSDEVYEWLVYDDYEHIRAATLPDMRDRTLTVGSAGKTFSATGFKTGWVIGPKYLISAAMSVHQGIVFACPTPIQIAIAETIKQERQLLGTDRSYWKWLVKLLAQKRDRMFSMSSRAGLNPVMPCSGYFMIMQPKDLVSKIYEERGNEEENPGLLAEIAMEWLIKEKNLACFPVTVCHSESRKKDFAHYLRFCFIKGDDTLDKAEAILNKL